MSRQSPVLTRRALLELAGATSVVSVAGNATAAVDKLTETPVKTFNATCSMECLHCNLKAEVKDGKIVRITDDNPFDGKACARGLSRIKWIYAKDRVLTPLKRVGEKGEGKFEPMTWDEALDLIADKMKDAIAKDGSQSILFSSSSGNMDNLANGTMNSFGDYLGGVTPQTGSLCCSAVTAAMEPMLGKRYVDTRDTIDQSKYILCWGNNPLVTMEAYWPRYLKAKDNGAKIVVIDPRKNETAYRADDWIAINPGTDSALGLGMIRVILAEDLIDKDFLKTHTGAPYLVGSDGKLMRADENDVNSYMVFDTKTQKAVRHDTEGVVPALKVPANVPIGAKTVLTVLEEEAEPWTPEAVEAETKVPAKKVIELAREYATSPASMIIQNMGSFQRIELGPYAPMAQFAVALLTGQIGKPGTGICDAGGAVQMAKFGAPIPKPATPPKKIPGIPKACFGQWALEDKPHKINVYYTQTCAPVGSWPNTNKVIAAMKKIPFVVVADSLMTPTAMYADVVLPVTAVFEYETIMAGARNHYVQWSEKAVEPQGEAKPDYWIWTQLAKRMGFGDAFDLTVDQMAENVLKPSGITLEQVKKAPVCPIGDKDWVPFADGVFWTPTKKAQLFVEAFQKKGYSPVLHYYRPTESPKGNPQLAEKYPLQVVQRKVIRNIHTSHQNNEWLKEVFAQCPSVLIHPEDASARNINDGDMVYVYNDRGEHKAKAVVTPDILPGVVSVENGWWYGVDGFQPSSVLTNDMEEPLGGGTCICSTLANVRRA